MTHEATEHGKGGVYSSKGQEFTRDTRYINDRIVAHPTAPWSDWLSTDS